MQQGQRHSGSGPALSARRSQAVPSGLRCSGDQRVVRNIFPCWYWFCYLYPNLAFPILLPGQAQPGVLLLML